MRLRGFITLLGGMAGTAAGAARAEQPAVPVVGYLGAESPDLFASRLRSFRQGLNADGYEEGRNVAIEYRWAEGHNDRLPALAADLVRREVAVLAAPGSVAAALASKAATSTIPIVFEIGADPVTVGLVETFFANRSERLAGLASRYAIPAVHQSREFTLAGGLMSYGGSIAQSHRVAGAYTGRILAGGKPADLPV